MYYISGMSTYAQMQYWQTREANMHQYLNTSQSQALMSAVTSSMTNLLGQRPATLANPPTRRNGLGSRLPQRLLQVRAPMNRGTDRAVLLKERRRFRGYA